MGVWLRKKFRFDPHSGGGSRKFFWPSSGTRRGTRPVPELGWRRQVGMGQSSGTGREPSRVPEIDQKTFRLPPPECPLNRNFSRRLPPIMYKGGIMYATQKRKFFRLRADYQPGTGTPGAVAARWQWAGLQPVGSYVYVSTGSNFRYRAGNPPCPRISGVPYLCHAE